jgi:outer membrane receptor for monomeric catechols
MTLIRLTPRLLVLAAGAAGAAFAQSSTPSAKPDAPITLRPFEVTAEASKGYRVSSASTATRTNTALIDIPQSVDIVTKEFWNDIGATSFDQSFKYLANVFVRNRHAGNGDNISLRGFETPGSISVDGVRMGNNKRDLVGYERLEVVKGPPSAVQGRAGGSGLLNYIAKKPQIGSNSRFVKYAFSFDEYDGYMNRVEFDANITPGSQQAFAARVAGAWQQGNDYIQFQKVKSRVLYPSFKWQITPRTELNVNAELLDLLTPSREEGHGFALYPEKLRRLIPRYDNSTDPITALGLPYDFNISGPGNDDKTKVANTTVFLTHQFNDWLYFRQVGHVRYFGYNQYWWTGENNLTTLIPSSSQGSVGWRRGQTAQGDLVAKYNLGSVAAAMTMVGYSYDDGSFEDSFYNGIPAAPFNTLNLAAMKAGGYSASYFNGRVANLPRATYTENDSYSRGYFVQQDVAFFQKRLLITGGLRSDKDVFETRSKITGLRTAGSRQTLNSWRYGATFKINPSLSVYVVNSLQNDTPSSVQRATRLTPGDPRLNEFFAISPGTELKEIGVKGEVFEGRLSVTANYWEMAKKDLTITFTSTTTSQAPSDFGTPINIAETFKYDGTSKGVELTAYGAITDRLSVIANYTVLDTSQLFKGQANSEGWSVATNNPGTIPLRFAPKWTGNLFVKHSLRDARQQGWEIKGGVTAVGKLLASLASGHGFAYIPDAQYSFDAGATYSWRKYQFDLMVTNLTEAPFLITRDQPPRTYRLSVSTTF